MIVAQESTRDFFEGGEVAMSKDPAPFEAEVEFSGKRSRVAPV
jgi:hypothetical protein